MSSQAIATMVYVTAPDTAEAENLARTMVEARLAACANVLGELRSFYWWGGAVQNEGEVAVLFKTSKAGVQALSDAIIRAHSYDCPCVVALDISSGNPEYLEWIVRETLPAKGAGKVKD